MFWLILVIIIVGYFIYRAIQQNSANNIVIAQQQYLNSQAYKDSLVQRECDMAYLEYVENFKANQIDILQAKIDLANLENERFNTKKLQSIYDAKPKTYTKKELINLKKLAIKELEEREKEIVDDYAKEKDKFNKKGFTAKDLLVIKKLYNLDSPFPSNDSYINSDGTSTWSMLEDQNRTITILSNKYRKMLAEKKSEFDIDIENAIKLVRENRRANISLLQRELGVNYGKAVRYMQELEDRKIIGKANGIRPREVL